MSLNLLEDNRIMDIRVSIKSMIWQNNSINQSGWQTWMCSGSCKLSRVIFSEWSCRLSITVSRCTTKMMAPIFSLHNSQSLQILGADKRQDQWPQSVMCSTCVIIRRAGISQSEASIVSVWPIRDQETDNTDSFQHNTETDGGRRKRGSQDSDMWSVDPIIAEIIAPDFQWKYTVHLQQTINMYSELWCVKPYSALI